MAIFYPANVTDDNIIFSEVPMGLARQDILDLARRYLSEEEITDFPFDGDLFCLLIRPLPVDRTPEEDEGWMFNGYGICLNYTYDEQTKPPGKWLWMHFTSLSSFPPAPQVLKLQPPHVVKGRFQSADRSHEIRIVKIAVTAEKNELKGSIPSAKKKPKKTASGIKPKNVVAFRKKGVP